MPFRWLCLHGLGENAESLNTQLALIRAMLARQHHCEFIFIQGEDETAAARENYSELYDGPFYRWFNWEEKRADLQQAQLEKSDRIIQNAILDYGPFDGIIGHSLGAALAYDFLMRQAVNIDSLISFRCAILFACPRSGVLWASKTEGVQKALAANKQGPISSLPTLHMIGKKDEWLDDCVKVEELCQPGAFRSVFHDGGHGIPMDLETCSAIVADISELVSTL